MCQHEWSSLLAAINHCSPKPTVVNQCQPDLDDLDCSFACVATSTWRGSGGEPGNKPLNKHGWLTTDDWWLMTGDDDDDDWWRLWLIMNDWWWMMIDDCNWCLMADGEHLSVTGMMIMIVMVMLDDACSVQLTGIRTVRWSTNPTFIDHRNQQS